MSCVFRHVAGHTEPYDLAVFGLNTNIIVGSVLEVIYGFNNRMTIYGELDCRIIFAVRLDDGRDRNAVCGIGPNYKGRLAA